MKKIFDFGNRVNTEKIMVKTWEDFRDSLAKGDFKYNEIDKAKLCTFLKVYNDLFCDHGGIQYLTKTLNDLKCFSFGRGAILKADETINTERFIPKSEFIKEDNRFSPAGVEWLYLAMGLENEIHECAQKECRANKGERFGFCKFQIKDEFFDKKIVDLTVSQEISFDELNDHLENYGHTVIQKGVEVAKKTGKIPNVDVNEFITIFTRWAVYTYTKLLSEQIFIPIKSNDKSLEYAPFQTIAQYFISLGYVGIVFGSTVCNKGKNIVVFDKNMAKPLENITDIVL